MFTCYVCNCKSNSVKGLILHFKVAHNLNELSTFTCKEGKCMRDFQNIKSFRKHLEKKHSKLKKSCITLNNAHEQFGSEGFINESSPSTNQNESDDIVNSMITNPKCDSKIILKQIKNSALAFAMKLYSNPKLPRSCVQDVVNLTSDFLGSGFVSVIKDTIVKIDEVPENTKAELRQMLDCLENPFLDLDTEYLRFKTLEDSELLIKPIPYVIGELLFDKRDLTKTTITPGHAMGHYIPIKKVLKSIFEIPGVLDTCLLYLNETEPQNEPFCSILQGNLWSRIKSDNAGKLIFPLVLYYDDFETSNPLGSVAGVHKLGAVYYTVAGMPPECLSSLENIFLALLFYTSDRCQFGNRATFNILIKDLTSLENHGINVITNKGSFNLYFALTLIVGDNLGIHSVTGFVESFSANFPCRFCHVDKNALKYQTRADNNILRTVISYNLDLISNSASETGIKENCVWNDVPSFHVMVNQSCDVMHDLLEGVCRYVMADILYNFIYVEKLFTLETLHSRVRFFHYGYLERANIPPALKENNLKDGCIIMSASQMLCFVRYFSVVIGDLVPTSNLVWQLYLLLKQILDIVLSRSFQKGCIVLLSTLISEHNELYLKLFEKPLKPKFHFLLHYPQIMLQVGPLVNIWSMRFEAKHKEFKSNANAVSCRKNLTYTLALKHQLILSEKLMTKKNLDFVTEVGPAKHENLVEFQQLISLSNLDVIPVSWAKVKGITYKFQCVLVVGVCEVGMPRFGQVKGVFVDCNKEVYFGVEMFKTMGFCTHIQGYEVKHSNTLKVISYSELFDCTPTFVSCMATGENFVILRQTV